MSPPHFDLSMFVRVPLSSLLPLRNHSTGQIRFGPMTKPADEATTMGAALSISCKGSATITIFLLLLLLLLSFSLPISISPNAAAAAALCLPQWCSTSSAPGQPC